MQRMPEKILKQRRTGEKSVTVDKTKLQPLPRDLKLGIAASALTVGLFTIGTYFLATQPPSYQDKGDGYVVSYQTSGKDVSVELKLEEKLRNDAAKLNGLEVRVQETGQTAPLTRKNDLYVAALTPPEKYTLLVYGKGADGKEIPVTTLRFPPTK